MTQKNPDTNINWQALLGMMFGIVIFAGFIMLYPANKTAWYQQGLEDGKEITLEQSLKTHHNLEAIWKKKVEEEQLNYRKVIKKLEECDCKNTGLH